PCITSCNTGTTLCIRRRSVRLCNWLAITLQIFQHIVPADDRLYPGIPSTNRPLLDGTANHILADKDAFSFQALTYLVDAAIQNFVPVFLRLNSGVRSHHSILSIYFCVQLPERTNHRSFPADGRSGHSENVDK